VGQDAASISHHYRNTNVASNISGQSRLLKTNMKKTIQLTCILTILWTGQLIAQSTNEYPHCNCVEEINEQYQLTCNNNKIVTGQYATACNKMFMPAWGLV
jgi:hypothetical protein